MTTPDTAGLPELPNPDTHCFDEDTKLDCWSYSADQMREYALADRAAQAAQPSKALSRAQVQALVIEVCDKIYPQDDASYSEADTVFYGAFVRAIEAAHGIHPAGKVDGCRCEACVPQGDFMNPENMRMILCAKCGNKRCPHATDHRNACTNSNDVGQKGSSWGNIKPATPKEPQT